MTSSGNGAERDDVIVIAEPHQLGDMLLTFPMAARLKRYWPACRVYFAAPPSCRPLVEASRFVDGFVDSRQVLAQPQVLRDLGTRIFLNPFPDEALGRAAREAAVPVRVGTLRRLRNATNCNRFIGYFKIRSRQHTIVRNLAHLQPLGLPPEPLPESSDQLYGLRVRAPLHDEFRALLDPQAFNLILHPKSGGHGREWPLAHYASLIRLLEGKPFRVFVTGVPAERERIIEEMPGLLESPSVVDMTGKLDLPQFLAFVAAADGMVAASTGPIHIAAAYGRRALGVYPCGEAINPLRWEPKGTYAETLTEGRVCYPGKGDCPRAKGPACPCTAAVQPQQVLQRLLPWLAERPPPAP